MKNTYKRNFLISLALVIVGSGMLIYSGARAFSYEANTAYTEFYFTGDFGSGDADLPIFNVDGTDGGATGDFSFGLKNLSTTEVLSGKFSFVDAVTLIAGTNVYGCKGEKDSTFFSSDITVSPNPFVLNTGSTATYTANFDFNQKVSGTYTGCVVYTPDGTIQDGVADAVPRKALIFAVNLTGTNPSHPVTMVANLYGRKGSDASGNIICNYYGFESSGLIMFYTGGTLGTSLPAYTGYVNMDRNGYGVSDLSVPNGNYDIVYKGWQQLAAYITGVNYTGQMINFVSGNNVVGLYEMLDSNTHQPVVCNGGTGYLMIGDVPDGSQRQDGNVGLGDYSRVYGQRSAANPHRICNLDNDDFGVVGADSALVISLLDQTDCFYNGTCYGSVLVDYFDR